MDFFEFVSMIFPLFMIALFIVIFAKKTAVNKKNHRTEAMQNSPQSFSPPSNSSSEVRSVHTPGPNPWPGRFPESNRSSSTVSSSKYSSQQEDKDTYIYNNEKDINQPLPSKEVRETSDKRNEPHLENLHRISKKLRNLPEFKKAVLWSEILKKPKGLQ